MRTLATLLLLAAAPVAAPIAAQHRGEQMQAYEARRAGRLLPFREIERRIVPQMGGAQYLGFDFDGERMVYTLKFLRAGNVIWVEVDGATGQVVGRSGR